MAQIGPRTHDSVSFLFGDYGLAYAEVALTISMDCLPSMMTKCLNQGQGTEGARGVHARQSVFVVI
jgi:hypothetical protein